jgi:hypothetical protein
MAQILSFPRKKQTDDSFDLAAKAIEDRFGVSLWEFMAIDGRRTPETQAKIDKALRKETFKIPLRDE